MCCSVLFYVFHGLYFEAHCNSFCERCYINKLCLLTFLPFLFFFSWCRNIDILKLKLFKYNEMVGEVQVIDLPVYKENRFVAFSYPQTSLKKLVFLYLHMIANKLFHLIPLNMTIDLWAYVHLLKINLLLFSPAEWSQALLYNKSKKPLHQQEHEGHLPRVHRKAGLYLFFFFF